jgi:hypothetical protein
MVGMLIEYIYVVWKVKESEKLRSPLKAAFTMSVIPLRKYPAV